MIIPDALQANLALVICGTAPSLASKEARAYYAHPGNIFWKTLFAVGLTRTLLAPQDYADVLTQGLGLTDLNKTEWGSDAELTAPAFDIDQFSAKMRVTRPSVIAFDSKFAATKFFGRKTVTYGLQAERHAGAALFVVPSTSGRARRYFDIGPWQDLARLVNQHR